MKFMTSPRILTATLFGCLIIANLQAQVLFEDDFEVDRAQDWIVYDESVDGVPDAVVSFAHDYSQDTYAITSGGTTEYVSVPSNPFVADGSPSKRALKVMVNADDQPAEASVSLFPKGLNVVGDHALRFEMFMSYNGPAYGGSGSTELATMGVGHSGELVTFLRGNGALDGDGTFFAVSGEGGASRDYRAYTGDGFAEPDFLDEQLQRYGFTDMDGDGVGEYNAYGGGPMEKVFPFPPHETSGTPGKGWVAVEVRRVGNQVTWVMDGHIIATISEDLTLFGGGNVMIGYSDPFSSIANPGEENFVLFDNVRVVSISQGALLPEVGVKVEGSVVEDPDSGLSQFQSNPVAEDQAAATFTLSRTGDAGSSLKVSYRLEGSAREGVDYRAPASHELVFAAGESSISLELSLINDAEEEMDETIVLVIEPDASYETAAGKYAQIPLLDDGDSGLPLPDVLAGATVIFDEDFESDVSAQWTINRSSDDTSSTFGYDYSVDGIPPAPSGTGKTTRGLKFTANESEGVAAHIMASPTGKSFEGDHALVFDLWMNVNGPMPGGGGGSTEFAAAGIATTGDHIQVGDELSDGAWFLLTGEGGSSRDFRFFLNQDYLMDDRGVYLAGSQDASNAYYASIFPEGKTAPALQVSEFPAQDGATSAGQVAFQWVQVQLIKKGDNVTWSLNGTDIVQASQSTAPFKNEGNIFLGYSDWFASVSDNDFMSFGLFDNLRVYQLSSSTVALAIGIERSGSDLQITYSGSLQSAPSPAGPWQPVAEAASPFSVDPAAAAMTFYRVVP